MASPEYRSCLFCDMMKDMLVLAPDSEHEAIRLRLTVHKAEVHTKELVTDSKTHDEPGL